MANTNTPRGLVPVRRVDGLPWNNNLRTYVITATDTNTYFVGDAVTKVAAKANAQGIPAVSLTAGGSGNPITGVIAGWAVAQSGYQAPAVATTIGNYYRPAGVATQDILVLVADDPNILFEIQTSGASGLAVAGVGKNANLTYATGSPFTGESRSVLDSTSTGTDATKQLNIIEFQQAPDNAPGQYSKVLVRLNGATEVPNSTGI